MWGNDYTRETFALVILIGYVYMYVCDTLRLHVCIPCALCNKCVVRPGIKSGVICITKFYHDGCMAMHDSSS